MKNFLRYFSIILSNDKGETLDLSEQRCQFKVEQQDHRWPKIGNFSIYNLSSQTSAKVRGKEFSKITVNAGYLENFGLIFSGEIVYSVTSRVSQVDIVTTIQCVDGNSFYAGTTLNKTIAAGYQQSDIYDQIIESYIQDGIKTGVTPQLPDVKMPRGKVMCGLAKDYLTAFSSTNEASFYVENGEMMLIPKESYIGEGVVLNPATGLIGMPQQTIGEGVNVRCLINPLIKMNGLIIVDLASIYRAKLNADLLYSQSGVTSEEQNGLLQVSGTIQQPASLSTDGNYIVKNITFSGDTRGNEWYMDIICLAQGSADLLNSSALNKVS